MKIGDIVTEMPFVDSVDGIAAEDRGPRKGRVVWIHPQRRFYRVEFSTPLGYKWTECFYFQERRGNPNAPMKPKQHYGARHHSAMPGTSLSDQRLR